MKTVMKNVFFIIALCLTKPLYAGESSAKKELLSDIKVETKKCAVQVVTTTEENENVISYKSICDGLKITAQNEAAIMIDGEWLKAVITESAESDGGDLNDLIIYNLKGEILATKTNIAAFDSVIVAMAGDSNFNHKEQTKN